MVNDRGAMSWSRVAKSAKGLFARAMLFCFTLLLAFKLDGRVSYSWWIIFGPLWMFHAVVARYRFSLPAPSSPHGREWAPCHTVVAMPLLIAFELLLCIYLENIDAGTEQFMSMKTVFLPLLAFEIIVLVDNFRMCRALMPGDDEILSEETIWETLPHFWIAISMVFLIAATSFMLLKLSGDVGALGWWDLFINFGIAECFAFLVCTKWSNPIIYRQPQQSEASSNFPLSSEHSWNNTPMLSSMEGPSEDRLCGLQDIGGHIMKIPLIVFQILLCMRLEGTPASAQHMPVSAVLSPILILQGVAILFAAWRLVEKIFLLLHSESLGEAYLAIASRAYDCFAFLHHGSRLVGWWSIDERSKEEQVRLYYTGGTGYNTFCGYPPEVVKNMPKKELMQEISQLQAALREQTEITKHSLQKYERLQNEKLLCRICFAGEISAILLPCRHCTLCMTCSEKCIKCPICRVAIKERMLLCDV